MVKISNYKAFIAAPLLGTLIFLIGVMVATSIQKIDSQNAQLIASEAYHHRLSSLMEAYRTDMGSTFTIALSNAIEMGLSQGCWSNLRAVRVNMNSGGSITGPGGTVAIPFASASTNTYYEKYERYYRCKETVNTLQDVMCAPNANDDGTCVGGGNTCLTDTRSYGFANWASQAAKNLPYEGISIVPDPVNAAAFKNTFVNAPGAPNPDFAIANCKKLISSLLVDCEAFSRGVLQCCSENTGFSNINDLGSVPDEVKNYFAGDQCGVGSNHGQIISGCEKGGFYAKIDVQNADLAPNMLRTQIQDQAGNVIRAGAIADKNFTLFINYPMFYYMDAMFNISKIFGFGEGVIENNVATSSPTVGKDFGVLQGLCYGPGCTGGVPFAPTNNPNTFNPGGSKSLFYTKFAATLNAACKVAKAKKLDLFVRYTDVGASADFGTYISCLDDSADTPAIVLPTVLGSNFGLFTRSVVPQQGQPVVVSNGDISARLGIQSDASSSFITHFEPQFYFLDSDPSHAVVTGSNRYCWSPSLDYVSNAGFSYNLITPPTPS